MLSLFKLLLEPMMQRLPLLDGFCAGVVRVA